MQCAVICPNVTVKTQDRMIIAQSKRVRAGSITLINLFVLFLFRFRPFFDLIEAAAALRSIVLRYACAPADTHSYLTTVCVLFKIFVFRVFLY